MGKEAGVAPLLPTNREAARTERGRGAWCPRRAAVEGECQASVQENHSRTGSPRIAPRHRRRWRHWHHCRPRHGRASPRPHAPPHRPATAPGSVVELVGSSAIHTAPRRAPRHGQPRPCAEACAAPTPPRCAPPRRDPLLEPLARRGPGLPGSRHASASSLRVNRVRERQVSPPVRHGQLPPAPRRRGAGARALLAARVRPNVLRVQLQKRQPVRAGHPAGLPEEGLQRAHRGLEVHHVQEDHPVHRLRGQRIAPRQPRDPQLRLGRVLLQGKVLPAVRLWRPPGGVLLPHQQLQRRGQPRRQRGRPARLAVPGGALLNAPATMQQHQQQPDVLAGP